MMVNPTDAEIVALVQREAERLKASTNLQAAAIGRLYELGFREAWLLWGSREEPRVAERALLLVLAQMITERAVGWQLPADASKEIAEAFLLDLRMNVLRGIEAGVEARELRKGGDS